MPRPEPLRRSLTVVALLAGAGLSAGAQQTLSLQEAVDRAIDASFAVERGELNLTRDRVALRTTELSRYPNISFGGSAGYQFGRTIDPVTNDFVSQEIGTNTFNLNAGVPLYQGGLIRRTLTQNRAQIAASEATLEDIRQEVSLNTVAAYLEVLLAEEESNAARDQVGVSAEALRRVEALVAAGQLPRVDRFEPAATLARNEQQLAAVENKLAAARLALRQLLRLPPGGELSLATLDSARFESIELPPTSPAELFATAAERQPGIRAALLGEQAAEAGVDVARSGYLPTVAAFGQLRTNASTQAFSFPTFTGETTIVEQTLFFDGQPVTVGVPQPEQIRNPDPTYLDQLEENFGQSVGLQLNVPIFSNGQNRANVERAELAVAEAKLATEQERQDLENDVQIAYQQAIGARAEVAAAERALEAARQAYAAAERRAALGQGSRFDVTNAQILLEQAQTNRLRARYQFLFNAKVVDFYLGRPLTLD